MSLKPTGTEARICEDIAKRQSIGVAKYGTTVEQHPLSLREWLQHAYEECLDQAVYLKRAIEKIDSEGRDPDGDREVIDGWQVIRNPPLNLVIEEGDQWKWEGEPDTCWANCLGVGNTVDHEWCINYKQLQIRRRIQPALTYDHACIPEAVEQESNRDNVTVATVNGFNIGLQIWSTDDRYFGKFYVSKNDFDYLHRSGFVASGADYFESFAEAKKAAKNYRARPDEIPQRPFDKYKVLDIDGNPIRDIGKDVASEPTPERAAVKEMLRDTPLQLREGAYYLRRDGETVGPCKPRTSDRFPWCVGGYWYRDDGVWSGNNTRDLDLLHEVPAPQPAEDSEPSKADVTSEGWIEWKGYAGAASPVDGEQVVEVETYEPVPAGSTFTNKASHFYWWVQDGLPSAIRRYRVVQPAPKQHRPFASADVHEVLQMINEAMDAIEKKYNRVEQPVGYYPLDNGEMCALMKLRNRILDKWLEATSGVEVK